MLSTLARISRALSLGTILFLLSAPVGSLVAQVPNEVEIADNFWAYSIYWSGSISGGSIATIALPATNVTRGVYFYAATITPTVDCIVEVRVNGAAPTTTPASFNNLTAPSVTGLNGAPTPAFSFYPAANTGTGAFVTQFSFTAGQPKTIKIIGHRLPTGTASNRNISLHFQGATGNAEVSGSILQAKNPPK